MAPPSSFHEGPTRRALYFCNFGTNPEGLQSILAAETLREKFPARFLAAAVPSSAAKFTQQDPSGPEGTCSMSKAIGILSLFFAITLVANAQTTVKPVVRAVSRSEEHTSELQSLRH